MDTTSIVLLITLIFNTGLAAVIFYSNRKRRLNLLASLFVSVISVWILSIISLRITLASGWGNLAFASAAMIPAALLALSYDFPGHAFSWRKHAALFGLAALMSILSFKGGLIFDGSLSLQKGSIVPEKIGPLYPFFILYFLAFFILALVHISRAYQKSTGIEKAQIRYIFAGAALAILLGAASSLILPLFGVYAFNGISPAFTLLVSGSMTYAIVKHRFLDIRLLVARSIAYSMLLGTMALVYGAAIFWLSTFIFKNSNSILQNAVYVALAIFMAFTFQPLRAFFQRVTDRIFYRDRYNSQEVINSFTQILVSELDLQRILKRTLTALCESIHVEFGQIVVFNADRVYSIEHYGPLPKRLMVAPELRRLNRAMIVADELEVGERKKILDEHGVRVSMMLTTREDFVGYLLLGEKLSGGIYSTQDVELLEIIRGELAVAIQNAKAYTEIQAFNVTLQARVDHATNRLRVANRHLQELDKAKDEFISMASHQLRTPLTTIKGYLSMMLEGDVGKVSADQAQFIRYAFDASERMVNLISDLLNVSRMSAGRFLIQTKPTDMVQMIDDEVRQLTPHARAKKIGLVFEHPKEQLGLIEIDDNKTRQVIMNFIDNAIYYTSAGEVRVTLQQSGDHVTLRVKDTGIGVPEEAKKKLFTKFFRAGNAQSVRPDGTGLGLYLAKRVIEDQGGTIIFESAEGKGSTFGFELPLKPVAAPHKDKDKVKEKTHGR